MDIPELITPRLRLRGFAPRDLDACAAMSADAEVMRCIGEGHPEGRDIGWLLERQAWGRREPGLRQLISLIRAGDPPSERLALHLGARLETQVPMMGSPANLFRYPD